MSRRRSDLRTPADSGCVTWYHYLAGRVFQSSGAIRRRVANAGDVADYTEWLDVHFGTNRLVRRREQVWDRMIEGLDGRPVVVFEFGVAWGYATDYWLHALPKADLTWHGFDRFTGLPRAWRGSTAGAFTAGGEPPRIDDARIQWHIGDVEQAVAEIPLDAIRDAQVVILFDLDIYEPSKVAWDRLLPVVTPGDLLYFDEAFDADERRLLDESVLPAGDYSFIGATPIALALRVERMGDGAASG